MVQNSKFTVQLLEKIGAPLAAALQSVPLKGDDTDVQAAKLMAQMLGQAVQISISLNSAFNLMENDAQADSTRLALASLAAPLIANFYSQNEAVPEDKDIKNLIKSLESVIAFADNFSAAEEGQSRLTTLDHNAPLFDKTQSALVVMQALTPVIIAVGEFSFGQSETKLMQDITAKLEETAADIAKNTKLSDKLSELMIFKALCQLYAETHRFETQKLANAPTDSSENRGDLSMAPVWKNFETKVAMVEAVMGIETAAAAPATASAGGAKAPAPVAPPIVEKPAEAKPVEAPAAPPASPPAGGPMSFFKKPDGAATAPSTATAPTPEATPAVATPPPEPAAAQPAPAVEETAQAPEAPATPPASPPSAPPSSPMGFFKPGAKKPDEDTAS